MNENDILKGRLKDLANAAFRQNRYTYTNFLSAADMEVFYSNLEQLSFAGYTIFGGRESCDRVMIAFGNEASRSWGGIPGSYLFIIGSAFNEEVFRRTDTQRLSGCTYESWH